MIFGTFSCGSADACGNAEGVILAHTLRLPGRLLKKGHLLTRADLAELRQHGIATVSGARLEAGDLDEDAAALAVARALAGESLRVGKPVAGRCNLFAAQHGLAVIDRERVDGVNLCDGAITVATLAPDDEAEAGQAVATVKVIPFAVSEKLVAECCLIAAGGGSEAGESETKATGAAIDVRPFRELRIGLVLSEGESIRESVLDATRDVMQQRLHALGNTIAFERRCNHGSGELMLAIQAAQHKGCELLLISGATITVDISDVVPSAIVALGGEIEHFGMPVEPGNMLLLARIGALTIINLPGCGRSPKLNGFDWVLQRILAGKNVTRRDILLMGVGGLIRDVPHTPRKQRAVVAVASLRDAGLPVAGLPEADLPEDNENLPEGNKKPLPRVAAVILAAGSSRRMGEQNKLLAAVDGKPMVAHVVEAALGSQADQVLVVTGFQPEAVESALAAFPVDFVYNPEYATGMASSLRTGLSALGDEMDAALVMLGDMPFVDSQLVNAVISAFNPDSGHDIVAPVCDGRRGNPVLWARRYFDEIAIIEGDTGARGLLKKYAGRIVEVAVTGDAVFVDIDTPENLRQLSAPMAARTEGNS